jgi:hypothetical protein
VYRDLFPCLRSTCWAHAGLGKAMARKQYLDSWRKRRVTAKECDSIEGQKNEVAHGSRTQIFRKRRALRKGEYTEGAEG